MNSFFTLFLFYFSLASSLSTLDSNAFKKFYTTTKGPQWTTQPPNQNDPCGWTVGTKISVVCVGDRITQLKIQSNNLAGTVPSNLKDLTQLTSLDLQGNVINGVFPKLTSTVLTSLNLKGNKFVGQIPDITSLTSLDYIDLSNNQFSSKVPSEYTTRSFDTLYLSTGNNLCPFGNYSTNAVNNDCPTTSTCSQCTSFTCAGRGSCTALSTSYYCFCTAGYYDDNCQTTYSTLQCNWDDCQSGYCNSATGDCVCATGFAGIDCEPDLCTPNPCKHGGTCTSFSFTSDFYCTCPIQYDGDLCEEDSGYNNAMTAAAASANAAIFYPIIFGFGVILAIIGFVINKEARNEVIFCFFLSIDNFVLFVIVAATALPVLVILIVAPIVGNYIALGIIYSKELKGKPEVDEFIKNHIFVTFFAFFFGGFNTEIFTILGSNVFRLPMFSLPFPHETWKKIVLCGFITNIVQDISYFVIGIYATISVSSVFIGSASILFAAYYICIGAALISLIYGFIRRILAAIQKPNKSETSNVALSQ